MEINTNVVSWFEIPVSNMDRAVKFYETVFGFQLEQHNFGGFDMAWFPYADKPGAPGSLVYDENFINHHTKVF